MLAQLSVNDLFNGIWAYFSLVFVCALGQPAIQAVYWSSLWIRILIGAIDIWPKNRQQVRIHHHQHIIIILNWFIPNDIFCTARVIARQFIVPFLLGLKFNLVTILPLLFAGILLLLKKAVFLGKFALFITGLLGFGGLLTFGQFGGLNQQYQPHRPFHGHGNGGGGLGSFGGFGQQDSLSAGYYKSGEQNVANFAAFERDPLFADSFYDYEKKLLQNKSDKLFDKEPKQPPTVTTTKPTPRSKSYRSFIWETA